MKIVVVLDGERHEVDVDLNRPIVRVGAHEWPIRLEDSSSGSLSFEILGERVEVRGDSPGGVTPSGSITINGELHTLVVESTAGATVRLPTVSAGTRPVPSAGGAPAGGQDNGPGVAVRPPMPGKVLEVRVRDGDTVQAGQVLLVLEAMKMRNDVMSPVAGKVVGLHVGAGANVGAHEVLLRVVPP